MSYAKLFSSIVYSTVWELPDPIRLVWITMLAIKDRDGVIEASLPGLARAARVDLDDAKHAVEVLSAPDPYSRTPDFEGRRIEAVDGGWQVLNHDKYRDKDDHDEHRRKDAERQKRKRERDKSRDVTPRHARSRQITTSDTDTDTDQEERHATSGHVQQSLLPSGADPESTRSAERAAPAGLEALKKKCEALPDEKRNAHQPAVAAFDERYRAAYGAKPTWGPKQVSQLKRLVRVHGVTEVVRRIGNLFEHPPAFLTPPFDVGTLVQHFDKLAIVPRRTQAISAQDRPRIKSDEPDREPQLPVWHSSASGGRP